MRQNEPVLTDRYKQQCLLTIAGVIDQADAEAGANGGYQTPEYEAHINELREAHRALYVHLWRLDLGTKSSERRASVV